MVRRRYRRRRRVTTRKYGQTKRIFPFTRRNQVSYYTRIPRGLALKRHHFKQTFHPSATYLVCNANCHYSATGTGAVGSGTLYGPATGDVSPAGYFTYTFCAADLPQITQFSALFDAYRLNKLVVKFIPLANSITVPNNTAGNLAASNQWLSTVLDYDDSTMLATEAQLLEYETFKQTAPYKRHTRSFIPAIAQDFYRTTGSTIAYGQTKKKWLDAAYTDVEMYGIKGLINGPAVMLDQVQTAWKVYVTAYVSFKQTR